ncbi:MAG: 4Fe-4S dicluster domain-containing protein [Myxococcota bacterium]
MDARRQTLAAQDLDALFLRLEQDGHQVVAPVVRDGAPLLEGVRSASALATGWQDDQTPGRYRLVPDPDGRFFGALHGPQSAKTWLHPPHATLFHATQSASGFRIADPEPTPRLALVGLRASDLAAVVVQDGVLGRAPWPDPHYTARRADVFLVAVQCHRAISTCFCRSMGTGPRVRSGYDLCLTEVVDNGGHRFVVEVGSEAGALVARDLPLVEAEGDADAPERAAADTEAAITRHLPTEGLRERLLDALDEPRWSEVAERCLGCANCTMVCPTCYCTAVDDVTDLEGGTSRERRWDSCFHTDFTHVHGGAVRTSLAARYRQWLTHKLATWHDQFGRGGCVGCGRCITWCPSGIDLVEEALR